MADFDKAFAELMECEGGWSDDRNDPGGLTRFGISSKAHPEVDLAGLTIEKAKEFYRKNYWEPAGCGQVEDQELAEELFKAAVNIGLGRARLIYRSIMNMNFSGPECAWLLRLRTFELNLVKYYAGLKGFNSFGRGWIHRILGDD